MLAIVQRAGLLVDADQGHIGDLFLEPRRYVPVPLEATYQAAFDAVPRRWQEELKP